MSFINGQLIHQEVLFMKSIHNSVYKSKSHYSLGIWVIESTINHIVKLDLLLEIWSSMKESKARHFMLKDNKFDECGAKNKSNKDNLRETNNIMH